MADDCRITKNQAERQDELTLQALDRGVATTQRQLEQLTAQSHASIQGVERRRRPRRRKR